ncbi:hypothetical protein I6A84_15075 [Frankia sp. CNm7]|uniref:Lipoprotein n=1 Tax=Frankia nepalensis TaxID=1836974 RepID=A0A937RS84_9ACTN|nr:DUF6174 domain-containing protein [Frankia nepalensis]MBL7497404.1 hypothetical protein [Frankia nepalensis]MBL7512107.1 hypothetical protein [Frankia nepalensis]MBL7519388.1 hypothetical protein [Frankia nepalensis]MBL7631793.1 hypothetical protein [Frankia nepalensis]
MTTKLIRIATSVAAAGLALALTACGDDIVGAAEASGPGSTAAPAGNATAEPGSYPEFPEPDYTYELELMCFCPLTGPVKVTVEGGRVVSAVTTQDAPGTPAGSAAPSFTRKTINDLIAIANDPEVDEVSVDWPESAAYPTRIVTDPIRNAIDDEVTYVVSDVTVH